MGLLEPTEQHLDTTVDLSVAADLVHQRLMAAFKRITHHVIKIISGWCLKHDSEISEECFFIYYMKSAERPSNG